VYVVSVDFETCIIIRLNEPTERRVEGHCREYFEVGAGVKLPRSLR
jgi:hypothetical protein